MTRILSALLLGLAASAPAAADAAAPAAPAGKAVVLSGADLYTVSHGVIPGGELLIRDGKIAALGAHVDAPADAARIELKGRRIYPGYIAADSILGLTEVEAVRATNDFTEVGAINPNVRAEVAVNPDSELIAVARANGVLTALVVPQGGRESLFTGQSALLQLDGWTWEQMTLRAPVGVHLNWPSARVPPWLPEEARGKAEEAARQRRAELDQAMADARAYAAAQRAGQVKTPDLRWEALLPVLAGQRPLFVHADTAEAIRDALAFAAREKLRLVLVGGSDAWRFADTLKAQDVAVILGSSHSLPARRWEAYDTVYASAAKLAKAGVRLAIANDAGPSFERNLPYQAASYAAFGLGEEAALRAITLGAAEILGVADRLGSLDVGKDATLFVANGDALDDRSGVERAWIGGREIDVSSKHTRLYEKYQSKYRGEPKR
ncbi:MAG: amidohydrolase family protein [Lysobacterales bacterium]